MKILKCNKILYMKKKKKKSITLFNLKTKITFNKRKNNYYNKIVIIIKSMKFQKKFHNYKILNKQQMNFKLFKKIKKRKQKIKNLNPQ